MMFSDSCLLLILDWQDEVLSQKSISGIVGKLT